MIVQPCPTSVPFASELAKHGDRPAIHTAEGTVGYRELADQVGALVETLGPVRRLVALEAENTLPSLQLYLAALSAGHALLLVPPGKGGGEGGILAGYDPDVLARVEGGRLVLDERRQGTRHELHPELALLLSTSGSTGSPKLVRLSARGVESNAEAIAQYLHVGPDDVAATTLPLSYCYGLSVINSHLQRGASVALTGLSVVDPCFWDVVRTKGVTSLAGVPYTFDLLDRIGFEDMDVPSLRFVTQAGGRLAPERVRAYAELGRRRGWDFYVMYGQTEATARMAYLPPDLAEEHPESIGVPIPGGTFELEPVPGLAADELVYRGPNVMLGYAERPEDLALGRTVHELRTGDLARRNSAGLYEIVGRRSRFVKIAGLRVDLGRAERHLAELGAVAAVAGDDERLVAAVEAASGPSLLGKELAQALSLPRAAVVVRAVEEIPRLPNGKPNYPAILALGAGTAPQRAAREAAGEGSTVEDVRRILAEALELDDVGETDSFVSLGGDSLSYVAASVRLERALGTLPSGWHLMPAVELATSGAAEKAGEGPAIEEARPRLRDRVVAPLDTGIVLRGLGIVMVVSTHIGLFSWPGMAHILIAVAGFNFARFHLSGGRRQRLAGQLRTLARILLPSVALIAFAWTVTDRYTLANVFLLDTFLGPRGWEVHAHFWFIERLAYILAGMAALTAVPSADRAMRRWPWAVPLALLGAGLASRFLTAEPGLPDGPVLWLFALGWAAAAADGAMRRWVLTLAAALASAGYFDDPWRDATILAGLVILIWLPRLPVPRALHRILGVLAGSSLYIYLTHWLVYPLLDQASKPLAVLASLAVGIAYCAAASKGMRAIEKLARRLFHCQRVPVALTRAESSRRSVVRSSARAASQRPGVAAGAGGGRPC
ncbi:MAG: AMP-binding protein [Sinomonas sp.]|nr:AMP-binding protein [Sinomonas sp.]